MIKALNDNADDFIKDLEFLPTFPFHYKYLRNAVRGDYLNVFVTFDLTLRRIGESVFTTSLGLDPNMKRIERGRQPAGLPHRGDGEPVRPGRGSVQDPARNGDAARGGAVMLDRLTRLQLSIFAIVTVLTVGAISVVLPASCPPRSGIGSYNVTANFVAGGGLYENANVTYRGVTVGRVESVGLTDDGVVAHMRLNSAHRCRRTSPRRSRASRRSASSTSTWCRRTTRRRPCCATARTSTSDHTAIGQDIAGLLTRGRRAGQQRRQQPDAGPAARNVQGVQRIRTRTGAADPVVAAARRRGQRQLRADHAADRPGRSVPGRADPQRRRHQVAGRRAGPVHQRGGQRRSRSCGRCCRPCPARRRRPTHVRRHPADVPDAGRQPGQLRPHRRDLPQVDRAGAGDLPRADGRADHRRRRRARRRGRQAGLQDRTCRIRRRARRASSRHR